MTSSGRSDRSTALKISVKRAGSFSGGECCHRSNGLSSSQGFSGSGMSIAGVVGRRLGDSPTLGRDLPPLFALRLAFASQLAICTGFSSVCFSSSTFSSSVMGSSAGQVLNKFATKAKFSLAFPFTIADGVKNFRQSILSAFWRTCSALWRSSEVWSARLSQCSGAICASNLV